MLIDFQRNLTEKVQKEPAMFAYAPNIVVKWIVLQEGLGEADEIITRSLL